MMKSRQKALLWILILLVVVFGFLVYRKNKQSTEVVSTPIQVQQVVGPEEHVVGSVGSETTQANGVVVAKNSTTIMPSMGGIVDTLSCSPGQEVYVGDVIAKLIPAKDLQTENLTIQRNSLGQQVNVVSDALNAGLANIDIQIAGLQQQKDTNIKQLALLQQNVANLEQQKRLSASDLAIQRESLQTQLDTLRAQEKTDNTKTETAFSTQIQGIQNSANAGLSLVNKTFGITNPDDVKYSKPYIGGKDPFGTNRIENGYYDMKRLVDNLDNVSPTQASADIQTTIDYFTLAANVINTSIIDSRYRTQAQVDALYAAFNNIATGLLQAKNGIDTTVAGLNTLDNTYSSQIKALENQLASLDKNKGAMSDISMDTQINGLQSQINSLQLAIDSSDNQLATLQNSKNIQTQQTNSQLLTLQQNYNTLNNNLAGEELLSPIAGVVKMANVSLGNKVGPGTPVCIIGPKNIEGLKIQFYSSQDLAVGKEVQVYVNGTLVGNGTIDTKGSYVDPITQNNSYELTSLKFSPLYKEGQKVTIRFSTAVEDDKVWIPLSFLIPRLDGYYVIKQTNNTIETQVRETKVEVGNINNNMVHILSGLHFGDIIQK